MSNSELVQHGGQPVAVNPLAQVPANVVDVLNGFSEDFFNSYGGTFKRISLDGKAFTVIDGSSKDTLMTQTVDGEFIPRKTLDVIVLAVNSGGDWCRMYYKNHTQGAADSPDWVWFAKDGYPAPIAHLCEDKKPDGRRFFTKHRTLAVSIIDINYQTSQIKFDFENIYRLTIGGSSIFGDDISTPSGLKCYNFVNLKNYLARHQLKSTAVMPIRLTLVDESVPSLRFCPLERKDPTSPTGTMPLIFDPGTLGQIAGKMAEKRSDLEAIIKIEKVSPDSDQPIPTKEELLTGMRGGETQAQKATTAAAKTTVDVPLTRVEEPGQTVVQAAPAGNTLDPEVLGAIEAGLGGSSLAGLAPETASPAQPAAAAPSASDLDAELDALLG